MARGRLLVAALLAVSALAVLVAPAGAATPAANKKFCNAAANIGSSSDSSSQPTQSQAKSAIPGFKKAAKYAPDKVKSAMNNIAKTLGAIAKVDNPADLVKVYTSSDFKTYAKSFTTYFKYYTAQCLGSS
jgi:hypothetical protein